MPLISYVFLSITFLVILVLIYSRANRKRKIPPMEKASYAQLLEEHVAFYRKLDGADKKRFLNEVFDFLNRVPIEGVGTEISDLDSVLIGASAIIPIFSFPNWRYQQLTTVILYPNTFNESFQFQGAHRNTLGMVGNGYMNGQMILSKEALYKGFSAQAGDHNTAIHEFVHLIDKSDGSIDGLPENLLDKPYVLPWIHLMHQEMKKIQSGKSDIDPYALTNQAEFFAVVAEYFFEKPEKLRGHHPELYAMLAQLFQIDLAKK